MRDADAAQSGVNAEEDALHVSDLLAQVEEQRVEIERLAAEVEQIALDRNDWRERVREQRQRLSQLKQELAVQRALADSSDATWLRTVANVLLLGYPSRPKFRLLPVLPGLLSYGRVKRALKRKGLFDADAYKRAYADIAAAPHIDPLYHYISTGIVEGRTRGDKPTSTVPAARGLTADLIKLDTRPAAPPHGIRIAVHVHMYYPDLTAEFVDHFSRIPCQFDIFASVPNEDARAKVVNSFSAIPNVALVDVRIVPNIGRDIAPFLVEFASVLANYDVVGHFHTKKSLYNNGSTDGWREYALDALLPSGNGISHLLRLLDEQKYGLVYPQCFSNLPYMANTWLSNIDLARIWAPRFGLDELPDGYFDFPVGSMFWASSDAIRPFLESGLDWSDFPPEKGQTDSTLAHCIERMLGAVPAFNGHRHGVIGDSRRPSWSRWRLDQFFERPVEHLQAAIASSTIPVIAFDIFDTLVVRPFLDPDYVKSLLHAEAGASGDEDFLLLRARAEAHARDSAGRDVDIHEIYRQLGTYTADALRTPEREIELEIASVRPRKEVVALLNAAVANGKRVLLASDMFLPRDVIEAMLKKCGVAGWHKLYLSSEIGLRKDTGRLYEHILAEERITPDQMLMIGDNERSDFQIPCDMKFHVAHLLKPATAMRAMPRMEHVVPDPRSASLSDQFLFGAIAAENYAAISYPNFSPDDMFGPSPRAIGYGLLGPIVVCFSQWLLENAAEERIDRLYFLSREGQFLKKAFDQWRIGQDVAVESRYLHVSRRSTTVPCLRSIRDIYAIAASGEFLGASMDAFLVARFGTVLGESTWAEAERQGLWYKDAPLFIKNGDIDHIREFLRLAAPEILKVAADERGGAQKYLRDAGLGFDGRPAVVDIGFAGTIQNYMMRLLDREIDGLYMMTVARAKRVAIDWDVIVKGCFVDAIAPGDPMPLIFDRSFLLEKMLSSEDEQVTRYSPSGSPEFSEPQPQTARALEVRKSLQDGAMDFVMEAAKFRNELAKDLTIGADRCRDLYAAFVSQLSRAEKEIFSALALDDFYCGRGMVSE